MGALTGQGVHIATATSQCTAAFVLSDNPPNYDTVSVEAVGLNVLNVLVMTAMVGVVKDASATPAVGTWHTILGCPHG